MANREVFSCFNRILNNLKLNSISTLIADVKSCLAGYDKSQDINYAEFICRVFRCISKLVEPLAKLLSDKEDILFDTMELFLDFLKTNYTTEKIRNLKGLLENSLYQLITTWTRLEYLEHALKLGTILRLYIQQNSNDPSLAKLFAALANNTYTCFWNCALKYESDTKNYDRGFEIRSFGVSFLAINHSSFANFLAKSVLCVQRYCTSKTAECDQNLVTKFFTETWEHINITSQLCAKNCDMKPIFSTLCQMVTYASYADPQVTSIQRIIAKIVNQFDSQRLKVQCVHIVHIEHYVKLFKYCLGLAALDVDEARLPFWTLQLSFGEVFTSKDADLAQFVLTMFATVFNQVTTFRHEKKLIEVICSDAATFGNLARSYIEHCCNDVGAKLIDHRVCLVCNIYKLLFFAVSEGYSDRECRCLIDISLICLDLICDSCSNEKIRTDNNTFMDQLAPRVKNTGRLFYQKKMYNEAILFLEKSIRLCTLLKKNLDEFWKETELLMSACVKLKDHGRALSTCARYLANPGSNPVSGFSWWLRIKRTASDKEIIEKTVLSVLHEQKVHVEENWALCLLKEELKFTKKERLTGACAKIISQIITRGNDLDKAMALLDLAQVSDALEPGQFLLPYNEKSQLELCQESLDLMKKVLVRVPNDLSIKLKMAEAHFWLYVFTARKYRNAALNEVNKAEAKKLELRKKEQRPSERDEEPDVVACDIQPAFAILSGVTENEIFRHLWKTSEIWTDVLNQTNNVFNEDVVATVKDRDVLQMIATTAEIFATAGNDVSTVRTWSILKEFSIRLGNLVYELVSCVALIRMFIKCGFLELAKSMILDVEERILPNLESEKRDVMTDMEIAKLESLKSSLRFEKGQFQEGFEILYSVLQKHGESDYSPQWFVHRMEARLLLARYLMLPPYLIRKTEECKLDSSVIYIVMLCYGQLQKCIKLHETDTRLDVLQKMRLQEEIIHLMLKSCLLLGEILIDVGNVRSSRFYLEDGLKITQTLIMTNWCVRILVTLGRLDLLTDSVSDCDVKLHGIDYIVNNKQADIELGSDSGQGSEELDLDTGFLCVRPENSPQYHRVRETYLEQIGQLPSTPFRAKNAKFSDKMSYKKVCQCKKCALCSLDFCMLETSFLKILRLIHNNSSSEEARRQLVSLKERCNEHVDQIADICDVFLKFPSNGRYANEAKSRIIGSQETSLLVRILIQSSILSGEPSYVGDASDILATSEFAKSIHCHLNSLVVYNRTLFALNDAKLGLSANLLAPHAKKQKATLDLAGSFAGLSLGATPPKIDAVSPRKTRSRKDFVYAPMKRDLLPSAVKQSMVAVREKDAKQFKQVLKFSDCDSDTDAPVFSPFPNTKTKTKPRTYETRPKRLTNRRCEPIKQRLDSDVFKFFEPKPKAISVTASKDIWGQMLGDKLASKDNKSCGNEKQPTKRCLRPKSANEAKVVKKVNEEKSKRSTRQMRKPNDSKMPNCTKALEKAECVEKTRSTAICQLGTSTGFSVNPTIVVHDDDYNDLFPIHDDDNSELPVMINQPKLMFEEEFAFSADDMEDNAKNMNPGTIEELKRLASELKEAISNIEHHPTVPLYANMCQLLVLIQSFLLKLDPEKSDKSQASELSFYVMQSFGITLRHQALLALCKCSAQQNPTLIGDLNVQSSTPHFKEKLQSLGFVIHAGDTVERLNKLLTRVPKTWTIVHVSVVKDAFRKDWLRVPTLLVCRYATEFAPNVVVDASERLTVNLMAEFQNIVHENVLSMTNDNVSLWWRARMKLDLRMKDLILSMESDWLCGWKSLFIGQPTNPERSKTIKKATRTICGTTPLDERLLNVIVDSASYLTKEELLNVICQLWPKCNNVKEIQKLAEKISKMSAALPQTERYPVVLILDKDIQGLPWESLPFFKMSPMTRMGSMDLVNYKLLQLSQESVLDRGVNSKNTFYVLNPSKDLDNTQKAFENAFSTIENWKGIVGDTPTPEQFLEAFTNYELFLYLGHGTGRSYFKGKSFDVSSFNASVVLMGCSSGCLKKPGPQFEATGFVQKYCLAGCPCIVANLWDVTDKDTDRFTKAFFENCLPEYDAKSPDFASFPKAIVPARDACRLKFLIGSAPVIYGLPICVSQR